MSPEYLSCLHSKEARACETDAGRLATLTNRRKATWPPNVTVGRG
jgi:hypothetical protein